MGCNLSAKSWVLNISSRSCNIKATLSSFKAFFTSLFRLFGHQNPMMWGPFLLFTRCYQHAIFGTFYFYFMKMSPSKRSAEDGDYRAELFLSFRCCSCRVPCCFWWPSIYMYSCLIFMGHLRRQRRAACLCIRKIHFRFGSVWFCLTLACLSLSLHLLLSAAVSYTYICTYILGIYGNGQLKYRFPAKVFKVPDGV